MPDSVFFSSGRRTTDRRQAKQWYSACLPALPKPRVPLRLALRTPNIVIVHGDYPLCWVEVVDDLREEHCLLDSGSIAHTDVLFTLHVELGKLAERQRLGLVAQPLGLVLPTRDARNQRVRISLSLLRIAMAEGRRVLTAIFGSSHH